jgi:predicted DsbA family dithiol-disulfide isomerase
VAAREFAGRAQFDRRAFLLLPRRGQREVYDDYLISHRRAAAKAAPDLGFAIPEPGKPYPASSLPAQRIAQRVQRTAPKRLEALEDEIFRAFFVRLEDISKPEVLVEAARAAGVAPAEVEAALADPAEEEGAFCEHREALEAGINGIPALVIPGIGPVVGAVPVEVYRQALASALGRAPDPPQRPGR